LGPRRNARSRWLAGLSGRDGALEVDAGAARAVMAGRSLLAVGITGIVNPFHTGDVVAVHHGGDEIAYGLAVTGSERAARADTGVVLHRDNMVILPHD